MNELPTDGEAPEARYRRRLRGFGYHLVGYFVLMIVLVAVNRLFTPETPWFVLPMVGWGSILAIHAAWVMGLFDILKPRK
jgi:hypothetical protein